MDEWMNEKKILWHIQKLTNVDLNLPRLVGTKK